jgi:hypothetical protein
MRQYARDGIIDAFAEAMALPEDVNKWNSLS